MISLQMLPSPSFNPGRVLHLLPERSFRCGGRGADRAVSVHSLSFGSQWCASYARFSRCLFYLNAKADVPLAEEIYILR